MKPAWNGQYQSFNEALKYMLDRQYTPVIYFWNVPDKTYTLNYWVMNQIEDITASNQDTDIPYTWSECICAGLASKLSLKYAPDKYPLLKSIYDEAFNFASTVQVATETATSTSELVVKTTSALTNFDKGDVLHDEDDQLIGTIKSITDANNIVLEENAASVSAVDKDLYNINPVKLILSFED